MHALNRPRSAPAHLGEGGSGSTVRTQGQDFGMTFWFRLIPDHPCSCISTVLPTGIDQNQPIRARKLWKRGGSYRCANQSIPYLEWLLSTLTATEVEFEDEISFLEKWR